MGETSQIIHKNLILLWQMLNLATGQNKNHLNMSPPLLCIHRTKQKLNIIVYQCHYSLKSHSMKIYEWGWHGSFDMPKSISSAELELASTYIKTSMNRLIISDDSFWQFVNPLYKGVVVCNEESLHYYSPAFPRQ